MRERVTILRKKKQVGPHDFKPGNPGGPGRPPGQQNKMTRLLKEAIVMAAEAAGDKLHDDPKNGLRFAELVGYLEWAALTYPKTFLGLLGRAMPLQVHQRTEITRREVYETYDQVRERLREQGIPVESVERILRIEHSSKQNNTEAE
jgi:hypothetical protein